MNMTRAPIIGLVVLVTVAFGFALVNRQLQAARERPAVQRIESVKRLQQLALAFRKYHTVHLGAWPEHFGDLLREQRLPAGITLVRGAGVYQYRKPPAGAPGDWIIMWSEANHAGVPKGAPFGAAGEVALNDIPPIAYVLRADLTVDELSLEQLDQRLSAAPPAAPPPAQPVGAGAPAGTAPGSGSVPPLVPQPAPQTAPQAAPQVLPPAPQPSPAQSPGRPAAGQ
jgi:hypothetical protein